MTESKRQLAAIMFTDIVGFTKLMGKDEKLALEILESSTTIQREIIERFNGQVLKEIGDGVLASFNSAVDAVSCSIEIQEAIDPMEQLNLKMGIHLGDVIFKVADVFGDGVNIASRVQELAGSNEILITESVFRNIKNHKSIKAKFFKEAQLKNVDELIKIYRIENFSLNEKSSSKFKLSNKFTKIARFSIGLTILLLSGYWISQWLYLQSKRNWARTEILPQIESYIEKNIYSDQYGWEAHMLINQIEQYIPEDSLLLRYISRASFEATIVSSPPGADVYGKKYDSDDEWQYFGKTPLEGIRFPLAFSKLRIEKSGYQPREDVIYSRRYLVDVILFTPDQTEKGMVFFKKDQSVISLVGYDHLPAKEIGDFWIDKHEVSNGEYKKFVDAGGYRDKKFWNYPIINDGIEIPWEDAMNLFIDRTGVQGPATWEAGTYPDGKKDYPVGGVSWYEAQAFAEFSGKELPTIYHWNLVGHTFLSGEAVPESNLKGIEPWPIGKSNSMNLGGTYDMAGNVREWIFNTEIKTGNKFILGGGWDDQAYSFTDAYTLPPIVRTSTNGIRCIKSVSQEGLSSLRSDLENPVRDYKSENPIDNETYELFIRQYSYDKSELYPQILYTDSSKQYWTEQKVKIKAAYGNEEIPLYVFLPNNYQPPYQTVILFPGDGGFYADPKEKITPPEFYLKSGRAVVVPIYLSTFERKDNLRSSIPNTSNQYKDHVIMWAKDLMRSVDYIESRADLDNDKLAYYGMSWGGRMSPIMLALDDRLKVAVLFVAGLRSQQTLPEVDPFNFLPRVNQPILMLNGEYDFYYPVESSQRPLFENVSTPTDHKKWKIYEGGHHVPKVELAKEAIEWLDKYFGKARK